MRDSSAAWRLIDLDASAAIDGPTAPKYSEVPPLPSPPTPDPAPDEAYLPPERQKVLLPTRASGRPVDGQETITALANHDVWAIGVLIFELCASADFWQKVLTRPCCYDSVLC